MQPNLAQKDRAKIFRSQEEKITFHYDPQKDRKRYGPRLRSPARPAALASRSKWKLIFSFCCLIVLLVMLLRNLP